MLVRTQYVFFALAMAAFSHCAASMPVEAGLSAAEQTTLAKGPESNDDSLTTFAGRATSLEQVGQLVYTENHSRALAGAGEMKTLYQDASGEIIGERIVNFADSRVTSYKLEQAAIDYSESVVRESGQIVITRSRGTETETKRIKPKEGFDYVIDAGFTNYVQRNWDLLSNGKPQKTYFVSPNRMQALYLQVKLIEPDDLGVSHFEMNIANALLKLVVKPIKFGFYSETKELAYYAGVSNLQAPNLEYYRVRIDYQY